MIRIKEAVDLYNARMLKKNRAAKRPDHYNQMNVQRVGMELYPEQNYKVANVSMNRLTTGKAASLKFEKIKVLCEVLGIDANFLFGMESKHDRDYKKLVIKD